MLGSSLASITLGNFADEGAGRRRRNLGRIIGPGQCNIDGCRRHTTMTVINADLKTFYQRFTFGKLLQRTIRNAIVPFNNTCITARRTLRRCCGQNTLVTRRPRNRDSVTVTQIKIRKFDGTICGVLSRSLTSIAIGNFADYCTGR